MAFGVAAISASMPSTAARWAPSGAAVRYARSGASAAAGRCSPRSRMTPSWYSASGYVGSTTSAWLTSASACLVRPCANSEYAIPVSASALEGSSCKRLAVLQGGEPGHAGVTVALRQIEPSRDVVRVLLHALLEERERVRGGVARDRLRRITIADRSRQQDRDGDGHGDAHHHDPGAPARRAGRGMMAVGRDGLAKGRQAVLSALACVDRTQDRHRPPFGVAPERPVLVVAQRPGGVFVLQLAEGREQQVPFVLQRIGQGLDRRAAPAAERPEDPGGGDGCHQPRTRAAERRSLVLLAVRGQRALEQPAVRGSQLVAERRARRSRPPALPCRRASSGHRHHGDDDPGAQQERGQDPRSRARPRAGAGSSGSSRRMRPRTGHGSRPAASLRAARSRSRSASPGPGPTGESATDRSWHTGHRSCEATARTRSWSDEDGGESDAR